MTPRYEHLFSPGPKRILALDGGGVRGAITLAFLERMEEMLSGLHGRQVLLHEYFDFIGGTSTGAVIAGALALGYRSSEIHSFYRTLAPRVFRRPFWRIMGLQAKFDFESLQHEIHSIVGDRRLDSDDLLTGLLIVMKRMDTGSPWIVSNNPLAPFWNTPVDSSFIGNHSYLLGRLIRASTAAPHYFDPEPLDVLGDGQPGLFVDGGVTPFNNPSLALLQHVTLPQFGLNWPFGAKNLTIFSLGTGTFRPRLQLSDFHNTPAIGLAIRALTGLLHDSQTQTLSLLQWLGQTATPWPINSEVGAMQGTKLPGGPLFGVIRYDIRLEQRWLSESIGQTLPEASLLRMRAMDDPDTINETYALAKLAAEIQVKSEHFEGLRPRQGDAQDSGNGVSI